MKDGIIAMMELGQLLEYFTLLQMPVASRMRENTLHLSQSASARQIRAPGKSLNTTPFPQAMPVD